MEEKNLEALQKSRTKRKESEQQPLAVRVVRAPNPKPAKIILFALGMIALLLGVLIFLEAIFLIKADRRLDQIEETLLSQQVQEETAVVPSLAGSSAQLGFMFDNSAPYDVQLCDVYGTLLESQSVSLNVINLSASSIEKLSALVNAQSVSRLAQQLNKADEDYVYECTIQNNTLSLTVFDAGSNEELYTSKGSLSLGGGYLLGNAANKRSQSVCEPLIGLLVRAAVLEIEAPCVQVDVQMQLDSNSQMDTNLQLSLNNLDLNTASSTLITYGDASLELTNS